jgi:ABC-type sugar transport system substrate-binding protein
MMRKLSISAAAALLAALPLAVAVAADLAGKWTTDGRYVFTFTRAGDAWTGKVAEAATGREFKLAEIVVDGDKVSFFVVHDAAWDEEVQANGGRAFRNTASGTLTDTTLTISGARERTGERAYTATLKRADLLK